MKLLALENLEGEFRCQLKRHMNLMHKREMALYLRHYLHLSAEHPDVFTTNMLSLADASLAGLRIHSAISGRTYSVPFSPPLRSLIVDSVTRLADMERECRSALDVPRPARPRDGCATEIEYLAPCGLEGLVMAGVLLYIFCVASLPWLVPGSPYARVLDAAWPFSGGAAGFRLLVEALLFPVLAIHLGEMVLFHLWKMRPLGIRPSSWVWWEWEISVFLEGAIAFRRIDRVTAEPLTNIGRCAILPIRWGL